MVGNGLIFCAQLRNIKNREEGENERELSKGIKEELLKSLTDGEIKFKFG